jgi:hypothetical protein
MTIQSEDKKPLKTAEDTGDQPRSISVTVDSGICGFRG